MTTIKGGTPVKALSEEEAWEIFDRTAQKELQLSGKDFIAAWSAGKFDDNPDRPELMRVVMLLPLIHSK